MYLYLFIYVSLIGNSIVIFIAVLFERKKIITSFNISFVFWTNFVDHTESRCMTGNPSCSGKQGFILRFVANLGRPKGSPNYNLQNCVLMLRKGTFMNRGISK